MSGDTAFFGAEFLAAVVGALFGGGISAAIQYYSFREQERVRKAIEGRQERLGAEAMKEKEALLAFSMLSKINRALTALTQIRDNLNNGFRHSLKNRMEFANGVLAIASDPDRISFTLEEMALVRDLRRDEIINDLMDLPYILDGYIDNMATFRRLRLEISDLAESGEIDRTGRAWSEFKGTGAFRAKIKLHEANTLLLAMFGRMFSDYRNTHDLFCNLQSALRARLGGDRMKVEWQIKPLPPISRFP